MYKTLGAIAEYSAYLATQCSRLLGYTVEIYSKLSKFIRKVAKRLHVYAVEINS